MFAFESLYMALQCVHVESFVSVVYFTALLKIKIFTVTITFKDNN